MHIEGIQCSRILKEKVVEYESHKSVSNAGDERIGSLTTTWSPRPSIEDTLLVYLFVKGRDDFNGRCLQLDQGYGATCVPAGIGERGECVTGVAAPGICELQQFRQHLQREFSILQS